MLKCDNCGTYEKNRYVKYYGMIKLCNNCRMNSQVEFLSHYNSIGIIEAEEIYKYKDLCLDQIARSTLNSSIKKELSLFVESCNPELSYTNSLEERIQKEENILQERDSTREKIQPLLDKEGLIFSIDGYDSYHIDVYDHKVILSFEEVAGSAFTNQRTAITHTLFYKDIIGVSHKKISINPGYLKFETMKSSDHTFLYDQNISDDYIVIVESYIVAKIEEYKKKDVVYVADEILKLKQLLDLGVLTTDEFNKKKKQLLEI